MSDRFTVRVWTAAAAAVAVLASAATPARALRCDTNPGGPEEIQVILDAGGSDIDLGWKDAAHNVGVPDGSSIRVCLAGCDTTTDPVCDISGTIEGVTSGTTTIGPPLPLYVDNRTQPACALIQFPAPGVTGTANVETGDILGDATLNAVVYPGPCPQCSGAAAGALGTCQGGATGGAPCTTEQITRVKFRTNDQAPLTDVDYTVSRDCLPGGLSYTISQDVTVATAAQSVTQPCPGQASGTNGHHECGQAGCGGACTPGSEANGGVHQGCCNDGTTACFPNAVTRTGSADTPAPAWPDPVYPKTSELTLAGALCVGSVDAGFVDPEVGFPGPLALLWPGVARWRADSDADGLYDDLDVTCPFDADCDDDGLIDGARTGSEDLDEDGVLDPGETDPLNPDSDGDGLPDGLEKGLTAPQRPDATDLGAGHFVADLDPTSTTDPTDADSDDDGIPDGVEDANQNGRVDAGETDPAGPPTTTTTLPTCATAAACDDGDPCTEDVCTPPVCSNPNLPPLAFAACEANEAKSAPLCEGTAIDPKLTRAIQKALSTVSAKLGAVGDTTGKKRAKAIKKARKTLQKLQKKVAKAVNKKKSPLPPDCATEIGALLAELLGLVPAS